MTWSLYQDKKFLEPLVFSNGKSQKDIVKEVLDAIKQGHKIIFIHGICGTGKCLDKNSLVFCKPSEEKYFKYYRISELVGKKGKILSLNTKGKIVESLFRNVRRTGKKKLYKLKTRTGRNIIASQNHPFLTITNKGTEWISLENLNESSYICLPNKIDISKKINYDDDKIKILAHLIAEGKLGDKIGSPVYFQCSKQNLEIRQDYINSLKNLFPDGEIKSYCGKDVVIVFRNMNTTKGTTNKLRLFVREHGLDGKKSDEKFIPKIIFNLENKKIALFLNRLFSCDGCIYINKGNSQREQIVVEYCSISERLIRDVSLLLGRFGIHHTITSKKFRDNQHYAWRICISNHEHLRKFIKNIGFIGKKQKLALKLYNKTKIHKFTNIDKVPRIIREYLKDLGYNYTELDRFLNYKEIEELRKNIGFKKIRKDKSVETPFVFNQQKIDFLRSHINKINKYVKDSVLSFICSEDIFWDKIKEIKFIKEDETYDLEVPKHHNFIADGMIIHNSAIALNIARKIGKTSIIVPGKNLQNQYKKDYEKNKYLLKANGEKLKINVITGRNNHKCQFLEDNEKAIPRIKKEIDSKLHDIFSGKIEEIKREIQNNSSADNRNIPCKIEIREQNWHRIKKYLKQNKKINLSDFSQIKDVKRISIASVCPYWSPVLQKKYEIKNLEEVKQRHYQGVSGTECVFYQRKKGCGFYEQFNSYIDSDVIVFNSLKYKLEFALGRKPMTEIEIIDEGDEFLDSFANQKNLNIDRLQNSLIRVFNEDKNFAKVKNELIEITKQIKRDKKIDMAAKTNEILALKNTGIYDLLKIMLNSKTFLDFIDEEDYLAQLEETARMFGEFLDETYVTFNKKENNLIASLVTTNLEKKFKELVDKNKIIILMSGTLHSDDVLKTIFGLENFKKIEAEKQHQGKIDILKTGLEVDGKYSNFLTKKLQRRDYLKALDKCVEIAKKPVLIHVNAFSDLPLETEIKEFNLKNLINRDELRDKQEQDKQGILINEFKKGETDILFSTRCARGIDFPGEECNSIIFTKYPNPNVQDAFWKILNKTKPQYYWNFYKDKARRELWQKVYRGLRSKEDKIYLLSPDSRVIKAFEEGKNLN